DDVLLGGLDLVGDVVDLATGGGQAHAVRLQVVDDVGAALGAALERLDELEDADVDALEHRGHDDLLELGLLDRLALVGVDADGLLAGRRGGLEHAEAGVARGVVDDLRAVLEHLLGRDLALVGGAEAGEVAVRREVLDVDPGVALDRLHAGLEARLELLDQLGLDTADVADVAALGLQRRGDTRQVGALLLGEEEAGHVGGVGGRVDDRELDLRVLLGGLLDVLAVGEADADDRVVARVGELGEQFAAVRAVSRRAQLLDLRAQLGLGLLQARVGGVVERLVTAATDVE